MTETEARKAFSTASNELQTAITKYQTARTSLHRITGEFVGTDSTLSMQLSVACAPPAPDSSNTNMQHVIQADC